MTEKNNSYINLKNLLTEQKGIVEEVVKSEEKLQEMIIKADFKRIAETQEKRDYLQGEIVRLEEERTAKIPEGQKIRDYINTVTLDNKEKEELRELLNNIADLLANLNLLNSINRDLLSERIRFIKEMRQVYLGDETSYTASGRVMSANEGEALRINRNC